MSGLELLQTVQYVTVKDQPLAVLSLEDWEALIEWIETLEDRDVAKQAAGALTSAGGDRVKAGWLKWDDVKKELD